MSVIRQLVADSTKDVERFNELAERVYALAEDRLPGTLHYECFAHATTGRFLWEETYRDPAADLEHLTTLTDSGLMDEVSQLVDLDGVTVLTPIDVPTSPSAPQRCLVRATARKPRTAP